MTAVASRFLWRTSAEGFVPVSEMATPHIFFALRMLFNHFAPTTYQIAGVKKWSSIGPSYTKEYLKDAVDAFVAELSGRTDLKPWMVVQLRHIQDSCREIFVKKIA